MQQHFILSGLFYYQKAKALERKKMIIKNRYGKKVCEIDELEQSVTIKKKDCLVTIRFRHDGPAEIIEAIA